MTASESVIGVIGGSGIYDIEGLSNTRWEGVSSPFGEPSDELLFGDVEGQRMVFLPRHGRGPSYLPTGSTTEPTSTRSSAPASPIFCPCPPWAR